VSFTPATPERWSPRRHHRGPQRFTEGFKEEEGGGRGRCCLPRSQPAGLVVPARRGKSPHERCVTMSIRALLVPKEALHLLWQLTRSTHQCARSAWSERTSSMTADHVPTRRRADGPPACTRRPSTDGRYGPQPSRRAIPPVRPGPAKRPTGPWWSQRRRRSAERARPVRARGECSAEPAHCDPDCRGGHRDMGGRTRLASESRKNMRLEAKARPESCTGQFSVRQRASVPALYPFTSFVCPSCLLRALRDPLGDRVRHRRTPMSQRPYSGGGSVRWGPPSPLRGSSSQPPLRSRLPGRPGCSRRSRPTWRPARTRGRRWRCASLRTRSRPRGGPPRHARR